MRVKRCSGRTLSETERGSRRQARVDYGEVGHYLRVSTNAESLSQDPTFRLIGSRKYLGGHDLALQSFETAARKQKENPPDRPHSSGSCSTRRRSSLQLDRCAGRGQQRSSKQLTIDAIA